MEWKCYNHTKLKYHLSYFSQVAGQLSKYTSKSVLLSAYIQWTKFIERNINRGKLLCFKKLFISGSLLLNGWMVVLMLMLVLVLVLLVISEGVNQAQAFVFFKKSSKKSSVEYFWV